MKLTCDAGELAAGLAAVTRALAPRTTLPVLGTVLMEAQGDRLHLSATNLEFGIQTAVEAEIAEDGSVAVPGRLLTEFTGAIGSERLEIELRTPGQRLTLCSPSYATEIHGVDPDEFPPVPPAGSGEPAVLPAGGLVEAITDTLPAASMDEARPLLTGIHIRCGGQRLTLTATDGYRVAERSITAEGCGALRAIVPARTMGEVARLFRNAGGNVEMTVSQQGNQVFFRGPEGEVSSRVIDGTYPSTDQLIPTACTTRACIDAGELNRRLRAVVPFAQQGANVVRLDVTADSIVLSAAAAEIGSARTELEADVSGPETSIAFNARYLLDSLATAADRIDLELQGPLSPLLVRRPARDDYLYLFMPVRYPG